MLHQHSTTSEGDGSGATCKDKANARFLHEVTCARFLYLDQFVVMSSGNKLNIYKYRLQDTKEDDLERLRNNNKYKLTGSYGSPAQALLTFSCINAFQSNLAICSASNRSLEVVDLSTLTCAGTLPEAHSRPISCVVQPSGTCFVAHPKEAYELIATSAPDNTVKLWDLRCLRSIGSFTGHKNCQVRVGLDFSPCMRYLATGSEDKAAYMYDLRQRVLLHKIRGGHGDTVSEVAFNPVHPQLAVACLNGQVHFYSEGS